MSAVIHDHLHAPNRFAVIPTGVRLNADPQYSGKGVTIAFLDSGFYPHPDLTNRILSYKDMTGERVSLDSSDVSESWQWHGTQTSVVAAGNGHLCDGVYKGLASESQLVLVKVSKNGRITEENIARGLKWVIANRERFNIRVLNISLGGDEDVPCSLSIIDQAAEEAISNGIIVVAAAGNSGDKRSIPPANSPSVITVGGYHDNNDLNGGNLELYHSNFGPTADGTVKPEIVAPAMWVAAPILPGTNLYARAEALALLSAEPSVDEVLRDLKIVATHYQHVDGTSFAAPIVTSIVAQMLEANPLLTPGAVKNILISTADRIADMPAIRQGFGVVNARRAIELAKNEQHALNVVGCSPPRVQNGKLVFVYHDDEARAVSLAGDFNDWNAATQPLTKDTTGLWSCEIPTPGSGRYQYKFVVDDKRWVEDPSNGLKVSDGFGGLNSVIVIQ
jgi:serine protease AprX